MKKEDTIFNIAAREIFSEYKSAWWRVARKGEKILKSVVSDGFKNKGEAEKLITIVSQEFRKAGVNSGYIIQRSMNGIYSSVNKRLIRKYISKATPLTQKEINILLRNNATNFSKIAIRDLGQSANIRQRLRNAFVQSFRKGEADEKIVQRIQKITRMNENEAMRVLRTERTRVEGQAQVGTCQEIYDKDGVRLRKKWICSFHNSRDSHIAMNGEIVFFDEPFSNGMMYPGDPSAPANEVVNCQCRLEIVR